MICNNCGRMLEPDSRFCPACGCRIEESSESFAEMKTEDLSLPYVETKKAARPVYTDNIADMKEKAGRAPEWMEKIIRIGMPAHGLALALYGITAEILYSKMRTFDITSVNSGGAPVHLFYTLTVWLGIALIVLLLVKGKRYEGGISWQKIAIPVIVTVMALINSQANTVYVQTEGGSLLGFGKYIFRALLSGGDPIDSFVYGKFTVFRYALVIIIGFAAAAYALLKGMTPEGKTVAANTPKMDISAIKVNKPISKVGKGFLIAGVIVMCAVLGTTIYFTSFASTKYELGDYISSPFYSGYNGSGVADRPEVIYENIDYKDKKAYDLETVLSSVSVEVTPAEGLKNGDKVTVTATYDKNLAKQHHIKLTDLSKEYTVEGLKERITAESIDAEALARLRDRGRNLVAEEADSYDKITVEPVATYLQRSDYPDEAGIYEDALYFIYKIEGSYRSWDDEIENETRYALVYTDTLEGAGSLESANVYVGYYHDTYEESVNYVTKLNGLGYQIEKLDK